MARFGRMAARAGRRASAARAAGRRAAAWLGRRCGPAALAAAAALVAAPAATLAPARLADARLKEAAAEVAARAAGLAQEEVVALIRGKAAELGIPEAAAPGAVAASRASDGLVGACAVRLRYSRRVGLCGLASMSLDTDAEVVRLFVVPPAGPEAPGTPQEGGEAERDGGQEGPAEPL